MGLRGPTMAQYDPAMADVSSGRCHASGHDMESIPQLNHDDKSGCGIRVAEWRVSAGRFLT